MLVLSSTVLAAGTLATGLALGTAAPASAAVQVTVCLTNASTQCADVRDSSNTVGTRIWLYAKSGAKDDKWIEAPDAGCAVAVACFYLEDAQNTSLCLATTGTGGAEIKLERCNDSGAWYNEGSNKLGNGFYGANATLITNGSATKDYLYANRTGNWHQWSIT
jgi:hypothetical protein